MKLDTLNNLNINEEALIVLNAIKTPNKQNIINLGVTEGSKIKCLYRSPFKDPTAYEIKNTILQCKTFKEQNINEKIKNIIVKNEDTE